MYTSQVLSSRSGTPEKHCFSAYGFELSTNDEDRYVAGTPLLYSVTSLGCVPREMQRLAWVPVASRWSRSLVSLNYLSMSLPYFQDGSNFYGGASHTSPSPCMHGCAVPEEQ